MTVTFPIPQWAIDPLTECGYNEEQIVKIFCAFLQEVVHDGYGQIATDFDNWLNSDDEEMLDFLKFIDKDKVASLK
jgi:hypothetical protein